MNIKLLLSLALLGSLGTAYGMQKRVTYGQFTFQNQLPSSILNDVKIGDTIVVENVPYRMNPRAPLFLTDAQGKTFAKNTKAIYGGTSKNPGSGVLTYTVTALPYRASLAPAGSVAARIQPQQINTPVAAQPVSPTRTTTPAPRSASRVTAVAQQPTLQVVDIPARPNPFTVAPAPVAQPQVPTPAPVYPYNNLDTQTAVRANRPNPFAVPAPAPAVQTQTTGQAPAYPYANLNTPAPNPAPRQAIARIERDLPAQPQRETVTPQVAITQQAPQPQAAQNMVFESEETTLKLRQPAQTAQITQEPVSVPQRAIITREIKPQVMQEIKLPEPQNAEISKENKPAARTPLTPFQQDPARDMGRLFRRVPVSQEPASAVTPAPAPQAAPTPVVVPQPAVEEPVLPMPVPVVNTDEQEAIAELERLMDQLKPWNLPPSQ